MGLANKKPLESAKRIKRVNASVLTNLAHEFLTPLSVISLNIQILERIEESITDTTPERRKHFLGNVKAQVERLNEVVHDSIELLKLDTFNEVVQLESSNLMELLEGIISNVKLCNHKLLFRSQISDENLAVMTDQRLLRTSIFRLVNHACNTHNNRVPELIIREDTDFAFIEILNHDVDLEEEDFDHIFNPFNRTTEMEKIEGMSLALTIIKDRLRLIQAKFEVSKLAESGIKYSIRIKK